MRHTYKGLQSEQIHGEDQQFKQPMDQYPRLRNTRRNNLGKLKNKLILIVVLCIFYLGFKTYVTFTKPSKIRNTKSIQDTNKDQDNGTFVLQINNEDNNVKDQQIRQKLVIINKNTQKKNKIRQQLDNPSGYITKIKNNINQHEYLSYSLKQYYNHLQSHIQVVTISTKNQSISYQCQHCLTVIINAIHNYAQNSQQFIYKFSQSVKNWLLLFVNNDMQINIIWLFGIDNNYKVLDILNNIYHSFKLNNITKYTTNVQTIDITYNFINKYIIYHSNVLYTHSNTKINQSIIKQIYKNKQIQQNNKVSIYCPSYISIIWKQITLTDINQSSIHKCIYIFSKLLLYYVSPVNFAIQNAYTIAQILIMPVLALAQMTNMIQSQQFVTETKNQQQQKLNIYLKNDQFLLADNNVNASDIHMCYVGFSIIPNQNDYQKIIRYLSSFMSLKNIQSFFIYYIIISVVYHQKQQQNLLELLKYIKQLQSDNIIIKLKIKQAPISGPLQVYQAAYSYCPKKSVIVSSRFNVSPHIQTIQKGIRSYKLCQGDKQALLGNYIYQSITNLQSNLNIKPDQKRKEYDHYFETHLAHGQIFCSQLTRTLQLYTVKWQQTIFYNTQYSYSIPLIQKALFKYSFSIQPLFTKHQNIKQTNIQMIQIEGLRLRKRFFTNLPQKDKIVQYNSIINCGLKRNASQIMPRILHQIWLSDQPRISPLKETLMNTLINTNSQFNHKLWTLSDIKKQNFPFTYDGIQKYTALGKENRKNLRALIADLMRIQILYWYGGIYLDMKVEGRKSLTAFLKYQQFFYYSSSQSLVNGIIGSIKGNQSFRKILQQIFRPQNLGMPTTHIYEKTGGTAIVKAYKQKQIIIQVLNLIQFVGQGERPCIDQNYDKTPDQDQKVFSGRSGKARPYKIFIPCKQNLDKYLQLYNVLGRTYFENAPIYW